MGEVYRGRDTRLDRAVAIKILGGAVASDASRVRRFEQEARSIAAVSHPNILAIFDVGGGTTPYLVTELLEGETLRAAIARGPLPPSKAVEVARQIVCGLGAAHSRGIVHRDLKPDNVFVTSDGLVKILDFGLAKTFQADEEAATRVLETQHGTVLGTVGYMSPEQTRGTTVDQRTDIFSAGAILYEALTGIGPFRRQTLADTMTAVLREEPPALSLRGEIPPGLASIVHRCLRKDPADRFQTAADLVSAFDSTATARSAQASDRPALAVLPFVSMTPDADDEYFADGLTEEIIADLAGVRALRVISRTSAMQFKGTRKDVRTVGRELGVRYLLEGSVRKAARNLRITAQLIDADTDTHLWGDKFSGTIDEVFDVQERVSREIVRALNVTLTSDEDIRLGGRAIADPRAFELYLRARQEVRLMGGGPERALALVAKAVEIEGATPPLRALMGWAKTQQVKAGTNRDMRLLDEAEEHARAVMAAAPGGAGGYAVMGYVDFERGRLENAVDSFTRALAFEPNDPDVLLYLGLGFMYAGQFERAADVSRQLTACDPLGALAWMFAGVIHWFPGRFAEGAAPIEHALAVDPNNFMGRWTLGYTYALQHRMADMERQIQWLEAAGPQVPYTRQLRALFDALSGRSDRALEALAPINKAALDQHLAFHVAEAYAMAGARAEALDLLARAVDNGFYPYPFIAEHCPFIASLRAEPEFAATAAAAKAKADAFERWVQTKAPATSAAGAHL